MTSTVIDESNRFTKVCRGVFGEAFFVIHLFVYIQSRGSLGIFFDTSLSSALAAKVGVINYFNLLKIG